MNFWGSGGVARCGDYEAYLSQKVCRRTAFWAGFRGLLLEVQVDTYQYSGNNGESNGKEHGKWNGRWDYSRASKGDLPVVRSLISFMMMVLPCIWPKASEIFSLDYTCSLAFSLCLRLPSFPGNAKF